MKEEKIMLNHGSGGKKSLELIQELFYKNFSNKILLQSYDSALVDLKTEKIAFTTDSFVVDPIIFPGGDIGKLAVCGTVNDLAVSKAIPKYLSAGFIIEEGLSIEILKKIVESMAKTAQKANIEIVTGDTKVVNRGKCDKLFINTAGIGILNNNQNKPGLEKKIKPGDKILINGHIADHGIAVMSARNDLHVKTDVLSDCAPLNGLIQDILTISEKVKFLRDPTRGGVATVLTELALNKKFGIEIFEEKIPVRESVRGMCEFFGFDPLYVANEGKVILVISENEAEKVLKAMQKNKYGKQTKIIGEVTDGHPGKVIMHTKIGGKRIIDMMIGEQLPRIC